MSNMTELSDPIHPSEHTSVHGSGAPAERETDGIILQGVKDAYWAHIPPAERHSATQYGWELPSGLIPDLPFAPTGHPDAERSMDLWQRAMRVYASPADSSSSGRPERKWLSRADQCGESWKKKGCPLSLEEPGPSTVIERLAAEVRMPRELFLPQTLFGWLLAWRVFEPAPAAARQGMLIDLASTTDWGKYSRGELEDWHAIAIADIRSAQQTMSVTAAVRHILMATKCGIRAKQRTRCITNHPELGVSVLADAAGHYPSVNAMICEWYALDMGLPAIADRACVSDAGRAYFGIAKMLNDIHDLPADTYTGDVGNGARLYGDGRHGARTLVTWLVGLGHLLPQMAAKVAGNSLSREDRTFIAGCAGVSYTFWGHRSDLWPVLGQMARESYGWGALTEADCTACRAAPRCGTCFYQDTGECTHLRRASLTGTDTDAAQIVNAALTVTGAAGLINPDATARAVSRMAKSSPTALGWHAERKRNVPATTVVAALTQGIYALAAECTHDERATLIGLARSAWWHVLPGFTSPEELALDIYMYSTAAHPHLTLTFGSHIADII
jgi:hypothetical protein